MVAKGGLAQKESTGMVDIPVSRRDVERAVAQSFEEIPQYFVWHAERFNNELEALANAYNSAATPEARRQAALDLSTKIDEIYDFRVHGIKLFQEALGGDRFPASLPNRQSTSEEDFNAALDRLGAEFANWRIDTAVVSSWGSEFVASYSDVFESTVSVNYTDWRDRDHDSGTLAEVFSAVMAERMNNVLDQARQRTGRGEASVSLSFLDSDQQFIAMLAADAFNVFHANPPADYVPGQAYTGNWQNYSAEVLPEGKIPGVIDFTGGQAVAKWAPWYGSTHVA